MAANTGAIYQPVASTPPATLVSWSLKTATQQGHPLPIHELSSAVLDHGPVPAGVTRQAGSPRCASAAVTARPPLTACSTQMALSPPLAIAQHRSVLRRLGGPPPRLWFAGRWPCRCSVAISAPVCCLSNSSKWAGAAGHLRRTMAHVVLALASSRSRYRSCATVARSVISHLAVAADVV